MELHDAALNRFLVEVFNEILTTEERCLSRRFRDLTLKELHLIEAVCLAVDQGRDNRATAMAEAQHVTAGTLTTAVSLLEGKGYLERRRDEKDRRAVRIYPSDKARRANAVHSAFHQEMVAQIVEALPEEETAVLTKALGHLADFFRKNYHQKEH